MFHTQMPNDFYKLIPKDSLMIQNDWIYYNRAIGVKHDNSCANQTINKKQLY